ncbi:MAG: toxin-antitoxin system HicB family antitoxin [Candidatus Saccharicenans sp.]|nr:toxin-antitoxin system HicB family antitoxin [Candidatus Saccharicenans sp.]
MSQGSKKERLDYYMELPYKVEITPISEEEGGGYEASIPQLGRMAFRGYGKTIDEALSHLEVVKRDLFERYQKKGVEIPKPAAEEKKYGGRILLRIPYYLHKELAQLAQKENISLNQFLNHLIERGLASLKYQNKPGDESKREKQ